MQRSKLSPLEKLAKTATWQERHQGLVSPNVGRKLIKALLAFDPEHHDDYKELYDNHNLRLLSCIADGCIIENEDLPAIDVLDMFLKCNDEKVLFMYHEFVRFIEFYCFFNTRFMDEEVQESLNQRRSQILGYQSQYSEFRLFDSHRESDIQGLENYLAESKSRLESCNDDLARKFLQDEIKQLKQYILKTAAKTNIDKTQEEEYFDVDPKWRQISYKFLEYWGHNVSPDEEYVPGYARKQRIAVDLFELAVANNDEQKIKKYKKELTEFPGMFTSTMSSLIMQLRFTCGRENRSEFFKYSLDILKASRMKYGFSVGFDNEERAVERLPIFLVLLGAEIRNYEDELYRDFEATVCKKLSLPSNSKDVNFSELLNKATTEFLSEMKEFI